MLKKSLAQEISDWFIQSFPYELFWLDETGNIVFANEKVCKNLGYKRSELETKTIFDINPRTTPEKWARHWEIVQAEQVNYFKTYHRRKNGSEVQVEVFAQFFSNNRKNYIVSLIQDIPNSTLYRGLMEQTELAAKVGGWEWDLLEGDLIASPTVLQLFQAKVGKDLLPAQLLPLFDPTSQERLKEAIRKITRVGTSYDLTLRGIDLQGIPKWYRTTANAVLEGQRVVKVIGMYQDITDQKQLELQLKSALAEIKSLKDQTEAENAYLKQEIKLNRNFEDIIYTSKTYAAVLHKAEQVAPSDTTVLITGESGTGKELLARAIHQMSKRKDCPLITINCAALPPDLIESELFGHKKGAFTGAVSDKIGRFELADGGTLFLDEIGELPINLQPKLLRVLQQGEFDRLGDQQTTQVDVRIIAATNRDLLERIQEQEFREDLYYRLNVFPLHSPPLRDRAEDIPLLAQHFLDRYSKKIGKRFTKIAKKTLEHLSNYPFPGNIRELENLIERAVITESGPSLKPGNWIPKTEASPPIPSAFQSFESMQKAYITQVLKHTSGRVSGPKGAAQILQLNPKTLFAKMNKLGIRKIDYLE